jgi:DNA-binding transcriptional regulator of glucitol operon
VRRVFTPKWCLAHLVLVAAVLVMLRLGLWQWHRAESKTGGIQNYAYAMQWPLFAVFAIVVYVKTMIEDLRHDEESPRHAPRQRALPPEQAGVMRQPGVRVGVRTGPNAIDDDDEETLAWNARLAALNAASAARDARPARSRATRQSPGS